MRVNKTKCCIALALALAIKNKQREKKRRIWTKNSDEKWHEFTSDDLLNELKLSFPNDFRNFLKMDGEAYKELMLLVEPKIKKIDTHIRKAITVNQRFAITLHFLATGEKFQYFKRAFGVSRQSVGDIVMETCKAIIKALKEYLQTPQTQDGWKTVAEEFNSRWKFPNCLGALHGMHVAIAKPHNSGSNFYNYKKFPSIALMALVNANCEFLMVDVGINGRVTDQEGVLNSTRFGRLLAENSLNLPEPNVLPSSKKRVPYVFLTDDAFPLTHQMIKSFTHTTDVTKEQTVFNSCLNQARSVGANAFGILLSRFGVLQRAISLSPEKSQTIVVACCYLHNYLNKKAPEQYITSSWVDSEIIGETTFCEGSWRGEYEIVALQPNQVHSMTETGQNIRKEFCEYFNNNAQKNL